MPKRNALSLTTLMTTGTLRMLVCPPMTSKNFFILFRMTEKAIKTSNLQEIIEHARKFEVIAIDEGQFFPEIVEFCEQLANEGKIIIVAALDGTFQRKAFGNIINLLPIA